MSRATIDVPGLGDVQFDSALSNRVCEEIFAESITALRVKLGQIVVTDETPNVKVTGSPDLSASPRGLPGYATEGEK